MRKKTANLARPDQDLTVVDVEQMTRRRDHLESKLPRLSPVEGKELYRLYLFFRLHAR